MITKIASHLTRLRRGERGAITVEFAFLAPIVVTILFSGFEFGRYVLISTKLDRAVTSIGDMATQNGQLATADLNDIFMAGEKVLEPYSLGTSGNAIVTHVTADGAGIPKVTWQKIGIGTGTTASEVGAQGQTATLPSYMTLIAGETVVVAEVNYTYSPLLFDLLVGSSAMRRVSYHRPRKSDSIELLN